MHRHGVGSQGAYLIVERAPAQLGREAGEYEPGRPGVGTICQITYADGQVCYTGQELGRTARACRSVGEKPVAQPGVTAASVASPVSVALAKRRVRVGYKTEVLPMFVISLCARVPVTSGASAYVISVTCGHTGDEGPILADIRRGQIITKAVAQSGCRGAAHIRVLYERDGGGAAPPFNPNGPGLTVGARTVVVH